MPNLAQNLTTIINHKNKNLPDSKILSFMAEIAKIPNIIKLTIGEPDLATPEHVKQAAIADINSDDSHYAPANGKPELLEAISSYLDRSIGVHYEPSNEICTTIGVTEALNIVCMGLLNPGDKILIPTPVWEVYFGIVEMAGGVAVQVDTSQDGFILTPEKLRDILEHEGKGAKAIILTDPSNPTGRVYSQAELEAIAAVITEYNIFSVSDEIYAELIYGGKKHYSLSQIIPERNILMSGLSKDFAMTGWRIGYVAGPKEVMDTIAKINSFLITSVPDNVQAAATEALNSGEHDPHLARQTYEKRMNLIQAGLEKNGFTMAKPEGAFYIFAKIPDKFGDDDNKFAHDLAQKAHVGLLPGSFFGKGGKGYVRLSYASSEEKLQEAIDRITEYSKNL